VNNIYFQYYSVLITLVSIVVMVGVSYATAPPSEALVGLTFATITRSSGASHAPAGPSWTWWRRA
jgi:SSS family solute:Na+ symporter